MRFAANNEGFSSTQLIVLQDKFWFERQQIAGRVVAICLKTVKDLIEAETPNLSLKDLEAECEKIILNNKCTATFKGYKGFPGSICTSVNNSLVHGIPNDYILKSGDVVAVDLGATFEGAIGDAAITAIYGPPKAQEHVRLLEACQEALQAGIDATVIGNQLGSIGEAIYQRVKKSGFGLITNYGGHGLAVNTPHAQPFVSNKSRRDEGIRIQPGLTIAIEPMLVIGDLATKTLNDGWTVQTQGINCHMEHTLFVGEDKIHIITKHSI
ncbi:MAG: type I methionyl aminopeptidase [bacterium]|nr:type I methionyl aminopeptidase [bacterium]